MGYQKNNYMLRVGMAQMDCKLGDVAFNVQKVIGIIEKHRDSLDLLVFPELTLTGYGVSSQFHEYALRTDSELFQHLVEATVGIRIVVGFIEEDDAFHFYNSVAIIQDQELVAVHRKIFLPNYGIFEERKYFAIGRDLTCIDLEGFRMAPYICGDAWNPALVHIGALDRAHILIFSVCSPEGALGTKLSSQASWKRLNRFYASMYGVYVIFVNRTGSERNIKFWGESELIDPFGNVVAASADDSEEVVIGTIERSVIREARTILNTVRDEDPRFLERQLRRVINK